MILTQAVTVKLPVSNSIVGGEGHGGQTFSAGTADTVQITPMTTTAAYDMTGVDIDRPFLLLTTPASASLYVMGGVVEFSSRSFRIMRPPFTFNVVPIASNCNVILSEIL